jgi:hypothetical protein
MNWERMCYVYTRIIFNPVLNRRLHDSFNQQVTRLRLLRKLKGMQLRPFAVIHKIGANNYILELSCSVRLHPVFHANNLRMCPTATLRPLFIVSTPDEDDEYGVVSFTHVKIDIVHGRRGQY